MASTPWRVHADHGSTATSYDSADDRGRPPAAGPRQSWTLDEVSWPDLPRKNRPGKRQREALKALQERSEETTGEVHLLPYQNCLCCCTSQPTSAPDKTQRSQTLKPPRRPCAARPPGKGGDVLSRRSRRQSWPTLQALRKDFAGEDPGSVGKARSGRATTDATAAAERGQPDFQGESPKFRAMIGAQRAFWAKFDKQKKEHAESLEEI
eukprot:s5291_g5.t1